MSDHSKYNGNEIAIVGMACRVPGANNIDEFWNLIQNGEEHITFLSQKQLSANGVLPEKLSDPNYIPARGTMDGVELFDAEFFGYSPMEAKYMDPQQRWFLETSWTALEHAGYCSSNFNGRIGVYAGAAWNSYLLNNLACHPEIFNSEAGHIALLGNDKDHLSTRVAYKLDLNGAAITIQTACSSSLVAVALACQSLRLYENDVVIAGGVSITAPVGGHIYRPGGTLSKDGHCRPFDDSANGTVVGDGVGIVVLRRLEDAVKDNDTIYGVIRSCAINNDGARKMGYTAPGIQGQVEAIMEALAEAAIPADTIGYIEAHGTGTLLGDPIEVAALTQAFRKHTDLKHFCAIGSVKANIGHLDAAAGVVGLIKTVLSLQHKKIPPSVNFNVSNAKIDFENSPFYINTELKQWNNGVPRRAAVSSFGLGGTNAHVIVEEAPAYIENSSTSKEQLIILSAKTKTALENIAKNLHEHVCNNPDVKLEDIAYTLQAGRKSLKYRTACICNDVEDLKNFLLNFESHNTHFDHINLPEGRRIPLPTYPFERKRYWIDPPTVNKKNSSLDELAASYMMGAFNKLGCFTTQGSKYSLHEILRNVSESYKQLVADWLEMLAEKGMLSKCDDHTYQANNIILQNEWTGDQLITTCGEALPKVIQQSAKPLELFLPVINAAPTTETYPESLLIEQLTKLLTQHINSKSLKILEVGGGTGIAATKVLPLLQPGHSYHFTDLNPYFVKQAKKRFEAFPNVTYEVLDLEKAPESQGIYDIVIAVNVLHALADLPQALTHIRKLLRPGGMLISWELTEATLDFAMTYGLLMSPINDGLGRSQGKPFLSVEQWKRQLEDAGFHGVNAYPENLDLGQSIIAATSNETQKWSPALTKKSDIRQWAYAPTWRRIAAKNEEPLHAGKQGRWLFFMDKAGVGEQLAEFARSQGENVVTIHAASAYSNNGDRFFIDPNCKEHFEGLVNELGTSVTHIIHLFTYDYIQQEIPDDISGLLEESKFLSLIYLIQVFGQRCASTLKRLAVVVPEANNVIGEELPQPLHAMVSGFCAAVEQELNGVACLCADVPRAANIPVRNLYRDLVYAPAASTIAYRGSQRWARSYEPFSLESPRHINFKKEGVYLITGGLGKIGMNIALHLAQTYSAKLVLLTRKEQPVSNSMLEQIREAAAALTISTTDVCDLDQVRALSKEIGPVNGIIHCAGILGDGGLAQKTPEDFCAVLSPKIMGYYNLQRAFNLDALDFVVLFSSLSAELPSFGQSAYASANAYIDAIADQGKKNIYSINWDVWKGDGMAYDTKTPELIAALKMADFDQRGILPEEGIEAFNRVIHSGRSRVMICTSDYLKSSEFERNNVTQLYMDALEGNSQSNDDEVEEFLVNAWKELLEIDNVKPGDSFIDLGGDSLIGMQLISRIKGKYGVMLPTGIVYSDCTIPKLCSEIRKDGTS